MSAVARFISDVVEDVVDAVGDVVESVVDVVADAAEWVGDTVQAVLDDPLPVLLSVAGSFIGIPPMVTNAAITASRGGDLGDIALSMGTSYFAPAATNAISSTLSSAIGDTIVNQAVSDTVVNAVSRGLVSGTIAEIRDGDFSDGFAGGFTGTLVQAGVTELTSYVQPEIAALAADIGLDQNAANIITNVGTKALTAGITAEVTGRSDFETQFTNNLVNSAANIGANYLTNTISDQFNTAVTTDQTFNGAGDEDDTDYVALTTPLDDSWNDTSGLVGTGAGIPDELVDEVEVSDIGQGTTSIQDDPMVVEAVADDVIATDLINDTLTDDSTISTSADDLIDDTLTADLAGFTTPTDGGGDVVQDVVAEDVTDLINEYGGSADVAEEPLFTNLTGFDDPTEITLLDDEEVVSDDVSDLVSAYTPTEDQDEVLTTSTVPEFQVGEDQEELLASTTPDFDDAEIADIVDGLGGLSMVGGTQAPVQEEEPISQVASRDEAGQVIRPEDLYDDVTANLVTTPIDETEKPTDVFGRPIGGLQSGLTRDAGGAGKNLVTGALNQILKPALRQGITKTLKRQVARPATPKPKPKRVVPVKAAPRRLSATQLAALQNRQQMQAPNAAAPTRKPAAQKVDVATLSPLKDITSLSALLAGGKGQG
jgi:hypothetical protein